MSRRILVVGDANLDLVLRGDVMPRFAQAEQLLDAVDLVLGSSAGICAVGLARLDITTGLCARIGDDLFGAETVRLLRAEGVDVTEVRTTDAPTGLSVILSAADDRAILTQTGAMALLTGADVIEAMARFTPTHLHLASLFLLPQMQAELLEILRAARAAGVTTSLDTNWDPAEQWAGVAEAIALLDVLLPNAAEVIAIAAASGLSAADAGAEDAARALAALGPIVAVKNGADGGFAFSGAEMVQAPGLVLDVIDTTGAGDSFDAGFLAAWVSGLPLVDCVRRGAVAGSLSTRAAGGTGAQATAAELEDTAQ